MISGFTGPIFAIFSPYESVLVKLTDLNLFFSISQGTLSWQPILGKIGKMTFIRQAGVPERLGIWQSRTVHDSRSVRIDSEVKRSKLKIT